jgi:transcriptional regulator with XRE-family HTH domain
MPKQSDLAKASGMWQSQISSVETPGAANMTLETLARLAAAFRVGLIVKFVPFSEMLHWEKTFSQDRFDVTRLSNDWAFLYPSALDKRVVSALQNPDTSEAGLDFRRNEHLPGLAAVPQPSKAQKDALISQHGYLFGTSQSQERVAHGITASHL